MFFITIIYLYYYCYYERLKGKQIKKTPFREFLNPLKQKKGYLPGFFIQFFFCTCLSFR